MKGRRNRRIQSLTHRSRFEPLYAVTRDPLVGDVSLGTARRVRCEMNGTKDRQ